MTLAQLRTDFGSQINQYNDATDSFVSGFITTNEANRWLNHAFEEVYKWYSVANREKMCVKANVSTVEDQATYVFGGDAADMLALAWVGIKYDTTDSYYTAVDFGSKFTDMYKTGGEKWSQSAPKAIEKQIYNTTAEKYMWAIEFVSDCIPDEAITNGLEIWYVERPSLMTEDTDIPEKLPTEMHKYIVQGARVNALRKMGEENHAANVERRFEETLRNFFIQEQSLTSKGTKRVKYPRRYVNKFFLRNR